MNNSNTSCACLCDGNGETPDTPSGDGDFCLMKVQWLFVLHVGCDVHSGVSQQKWSCSMAWKTSTSTVPLMQHSSGAAVSQLFTMWLRAVEMWNGIVSVLCECDHDGILWTEMLKLIRTKALSFWCICACATNPWLSYERFPESRSTTISCFTVLPKKSMIHICFSFSSFTLLSLFSSSHFNQ